MGKRILILSNHFITLFNFRRELIGRLVGEGNEVFISLPASERNRYFSDLGCRIIETPIMRRGINPIHDIGLIASYVRMMRRIRPDVVFSYTIKPNVYGCIASSLTGNRQISNVTGTGGTFLRRSLVGSIARTLYRVSLRRSYKVFFQNSGDRDYFVANGMVGDNWAMLPGSGVNLGEYEDRELPPGATVNFIYMGRIMEIKGIDQLLEAARTIREEFPDTRFYLAGWIEEERYRPVIEEHHAKGIIEYLGFQDGMKPWIERCHCTILPSHGGEGVPNALLESAAMGRACIASRIHGSREVVEDGVTGYLFEAGSAADLADRIRAYLRLEREERRRMGLAGRAKVAREFDRRIVVDAYMEEVAAV